MGHRHPFRIYYVRTAIVSIQCRVASIGTSVLPWSATKDEGRLAETPCV